MSSIITLLLTDLATGAIYAIVATGFRLLWQTRRPSTLRRESRNGCDLPRAGIW
jgi:hypothetical protein